MSVVYSYSKTMAGARRIAQERMAKLGVAQDTVEPQSVPAVSPEPFVPPLRALITEIAEQHGLTYSHIIGPSRSHKVIAARFDAIAAVANARPTMSLNHLGNVFHRDHTTILSALRKRGVR